MYQLSESQSAALEKAKQVTESVIAPHAASVDAESRFPKESMAALADAGLLGLTIPAEYGGMGEGLRTMVAVLDEVASGCASTGMVYLMHLCGVATYVARPDVAGDLLREAAAGRHLSTLAWSEKGSRSHFWAPVSRAVRENGHMVLNAEKSWVTSAGIANGYVVSTGIDGAESPLASTLYLIRDSDGSFEVAGPWDSLGMRGNASAPMRLKDAKVPADRALSPEGEGMNTMLGVVLPVFQLGNAAVSMGISRSAVSATQGHLTKSRLEHLGSSLSELPNLRARLASMQIRLDQSRAYLNSALNLVEAGDPSAMLMVLGAKAQAGEAAIEITDSAMRACGGAAFSKHLSVERNFRDARAASVMAPTVDVLHDFIGKALCGMELF